jgi:amidase
MKRWLCLLAAPTAVAVIGLSAQDRRDRQDVPNVSFRSNFNIVEATIPEMQAALSSGRVTSRELVLLYMSRIAQHEDLLNATAYVSRTALEEADRLDEERASGRIRGPLHGIPIAVKDIINTTNMPTTGGALILEGFVPKFEAPLVTNLKGLGAIILAKTTLTELANWVTSGMPANYSALFLYSMNPYDPRPDPRTGTNDGRPILSTGGSSSGVGTSANFWAASVGTETNGSILSPSSSNMLVGIKPTLGLISRWGIIPITADQDTAGPMARTVEDAAILLGAMTGVDPNDPATTTCTAGIDYRRHLLHSGLRGARIGIPRANYYRSTTRPDTGATVGPAMNADQVALMEQVIQILRNEGAAVVDPADIPSILDGTPANNFLTFPTCAGLANRKGMDAACSITFKYGMKRDYTAWATASGAPSLTQMRQYNLANRPRNAIRYEQENLDISDEMDIAADRARWQTDRNRDIFISRTHGIDEIMARERLDALLTGGTSFSAIAAKAGLPTITVPFGFVPNTATNLPAGFNARPGPFGASFTSGACNEGRLIEIAYAFEQATKRRVPPFSAP